MTPWLILLAGLLLDGTGTWNAVQRFGIASERNPALRYVMVRWGSLGGVLARLVCLGIVALIRVSWGADVGANAAIGLGWALAMTGLVAWNAARKWI